MGAPSDPNGQSVGGDPACSHVGPEKTSWATASGTRRGPAITKATMSKKELSPLKFRNQSLRSSILGLRSYPHSVVPAGLRSYPAHELIDVSDAPAPHFDLSDLNNAGQMLRSDRLKRRIRRPVRQACDAACRVGCAKRRRRRTPRGTPPQFLARAQVSRAWRALRARSGPETRFGRPAGSWSLLGRPLR